MSFPPMQALPLEYYFDSKFLPFREWLVASGARYVGHQLMVPSKGDYHLLPAFGNGAMLMNTGAEVTKLSNVCRHRQALIIDPVNRPGTDCARGNILRGQGGGVLTCPVHRWSYNEGGHLLTAPNFPSVSPVCLPKTELAMWNGFLFETSCDVAGAMQLLGASKLFDPLLLDMSQYVYAGSDPLMPYAFSLELFMKVYFDLYHVAPYHAQTFATAVDCMPLLKQQAAEYWERGSLHNVQIVSWQKRARKAKKGYGLLRPLITDLYEGKDPPHGALWVTLFPGMMIEWYPHVLVVSTLGHDGIDGCINQVDYFVQAKWQDRIGEILPIAKEAYNESAEEDAEICRSMQAGNYAMWKHELHAVGPRHPDLELGIDHFFEWVRAQAKVFGIAIP